MGFLDIDLELSDINNESSEKTNFYVVQRNSNRLLNWSIQLKNFLTVLNQKIQTAEIFKNILPLLNSSKSFIDLNYSLVVGFSEIQTINSEEFLITRIDDYTISIEKNNQLNWDTLALIIQVKNVFGLIENPEIITYNNKIIIKFSTIIDMNHKLLFI